MEQNTETCEQCGEIDDYRLTYTAHKCTHELCLRCFRNSVGTRRKSNTCKVCGSSNYDEMTKESRRLPFPYDEVEIPLRSAKKEPTFHHVMRSKPELKTSQENPQLPSTSHQNREVKSVTIEMEKPELETLRKDRQNRGVEEPKAPNNNIACKRYCQMLIFVFIFLLMFLLIILSVFNTRFTIKPIFYLLLQIL